MAGTLFCPNGHEGAGSDDSFCGACGAVLAPAPARQSTAAAGLLGLTWPQSLLAIAGAIALFGGAVGSGIVLEDEPGKGVGIVRASAAQETPAPTRAAAPTATSGGSSGALQSPDAATPTPTATLVPAQPTAAAAGPAPTATPRPPTATPTRAPATATPRPPTPTPTSIPIQIQPVLSVDAWFGVGFYVGEELQFCWSVTPDFTPYTYTIRQLSPVQQVVRPATQHPGGDDCMTGQIQAADVGKLTVRIEVTMKGTTVTAQDSKTILR